MGVLRQDLSELLPNNTRRTLLKKAGVTSFPLIVLAPDSLGCSRRCPLTEVWNIIEPQRRRSYQFHPRWGAIFRLTMCSLRSPSPAGRADRLALFRA